MRLSPSARRENSASSAAVWVRYSSRTGAAAGLGGAAAPGESAWSFDFSDEAIRAPSSDFIP